MEDRCRFWHPPQIPLVDEPRVLSSHTRPAQKMAPEAHPTVSQDVKLRDLTEEVAKELRDTEIQQLKKRFPKDQLIVQEREDGRVTYYRVTVEATDPDWVNISPQNQSIHTHILITFVYVGFGSGLEF